MTCISVIIPAFNAEKTILQTIKSVQEQTFSDLELIVINDGSTDKTLELVNSIDDCRIKIFSYVNGGLSTARNRGMTQARGEYITFLDADDLWAKDILEELLAALQNNPKAGVAYCWTYYMYEEKNLNYPSTPVYYEGNVYLQLLINNFLSVGACLITRNAIESVGNFDSSLKSAEDWHYWLQLARHWDFVLVPKHLFFYRQTSTSMSSNVEIMEKNTLKMLEKEWQVVPPELAYLKNKCLANVYIYLAQKCLLNVESIERHKEAVVKVWKAICLYPSILLDAVRDSWVRGLLLKILMIKVISAKLAINLMQYVRNQRANLR